MTQQGSGTAAVGPEQVGAEVVGIAAVARNGVIGDGPDIPWHVPGDQARFKRLTTGGVLLMGRRTYDSIGRPLPGRRTVVLSRGGWQPAPQHTAVVDVAADAGSALRRARQLGGTVFVAGGGEVYRLLWDALTALELTEVDQEPPGDVTFPDLDPSWVEVSREEHPGHVYRRLERGR